MSISLPFCSSLLNLHVAYSLTAVSTKLLMKDFLKSSHSLSLLHDVPFQISSWSFLSWLSFHSRTLSPSRNPRHNAMHWYGTYIETLLSFEIQYVLKSLRKSRALGLSPANGFGACPLSPPFVSVRWFIGGFSWGRNCSGLFPGILAYWFSARRRYWTALGLRPANVSWLICSVASANGAMGLGLLCALYGSLMGSTIFVKCRRSGGTAIGR